VLKAWCLSTGLHSHVGPYPASAEHAKVVIPYLAREVTLIRGAAFIQSKSEDIFRKFTFPIKSIYSISLNQLHNVLYLLKSPSPDFPPSKSWLSSLLPCGVYRQRSDRLAPETGHLAAAQLARLELQNLGGSLAASATARGHDAASPGRSARAAATHGWHSGSAPCHTAVGETPGPECRSPSRRGEASFWWVPGPAGMGACPRSAQPCRSRSGRCFEWRGWLEADAHPCCRGGCRGSPQGNALGSLLCGSPRLVATLRSGLRRWL